MRKKRGRSGKGGSETGKARRGAERNPRTAGCGGPSVFSGNTHVRGGPPFPLNSSPFPNGFLRSFISPPGAISKLAATRNETPRAPLVTAAFRRVSGPPTGQAGGRAGVQAQESRSPRVKPHIHRPRAQGDREGRLGEPQQL